LHEARDIMLTLLHERDWECASQWVGRYNSQFFQPTTARPPTQQSTEQAGESCGPSCASC
jgi:hypothetical protein